MLTSTRVKLAIRIAVTVVRYVACILLLVTGLLILSTAMTAVQMGLISGPADLGLYAAAAITAFWLSWRCWCSWPPARLGPEAEGCRDCCAAGFGLVDGLCDVCWEASLGLTWPPVDEVPLTPAIDLERLWEAPARRPPHEELRQLRPAVPAVPGLTGLDQPIHQVIELHPASPADPHRGVSFCSRCGTRTVRVDGLGPDPQWVHATSRPDGDL